jgi:hypothetical protein
LIPLIIAHAFSSLEIIGCNVHSILHVIESVCCIKDCENNPPIAITDPRNEMTVFGKTENFAPGSLSAKSSWSNFANGENFAIGKFLQLSFSWKYILPKNLVL